MSSFMTSRDLGSRCFKKEDGHLYVTVPTGVLDADGNPIYEDQCLSTNRLDSQCALSAVEYKKVDKLIVDEATSPNRITTWLRGLGSRVVEKFDGLRFKTYWYTTIDGKTTSRTTMDLEDDAPAVGISVAEKGVPLPIEFADWIWNIRRDPTASQSAGFDYALEKARLAARSVAKGNDLRIVNGWDGLTYRGNTVYGYRDVPTLLTVAQKGVYDAGGTTKRGWLVSDEATAEDIYNDIRKMVEVANLNGIKGPFILHVPESFRFRLAEIYHTNSITDKEKTLWHKLLETPSKDIPNVLDISQIKLMPELDVTATGGVPSTGEAYLVSINPEHFRVLDYLPMQSFTINLKGLITSKHRVAEGIVPLFKQDSAGNYGVVKLVPPADT